MKKIINKLFRLLGQQPKLKLTHKEEKKLIIELCAKKISQWGIKGGYYDFECYKGKTIINAHKAFKEYSLNINIYGFDDFRDAPNLKTDYYTSEIINKTKWSKKSLLNYLNNSDFGLNNTLITKIDYDDLPSSNLKSDINFDKAAIIWIDCNIYNNTLQVLNWVKEFIQTGTIIVFDDYFRFNPPYGESGAYQTFLNNSPDIKSHLLFSTGDRKVFVIEK